MKEFSYQCLEFGLKSHVASRNEKSVGHLKGYEGHSILYTLLRYVPEDIDVYGRSCFINFLLGRLSPSQNAVESMGFFEFFPIAMVMKEKGEEAFEVLYLRLSQIQNRYVN